MFSLPRMCKIAGTMGTDDQALEQLPDRITHALRGQLIAGERPILVLKTEWKPSATIPIVWLALTNQRCFLFSTLRGSHLFKVVTLDQLNSVIKGSGGIRVLLQNGEDWEVPIDRAHAAQMDAFLMETSARIPNRLHSRT